MNTSSQPFRFAQITDTHIFGGGEDFAVEHEPNLRRILADIESHLPESEFILHTGDVGGMAGRDIDYALHRKIVDTCAKPIHYIPGNHDKRLDGFRKIVLDEEPSTDPIYWSMEKHGWFFVALDSSHGVDKTQVRWFSEQLAQHPDLPTFVLIHHQLLPLGSLYQDTRMIPNNHELVAIIVDASQVRAVMSGHVHMDRILIYQNIAFITTPSTVFQISPLHHVKTNDDRPPGYRVFSTDPDGTITTYIRRVPKDGAYDDNVVALPGRAGTTV